MKISNEESKDAAVVTRLNSWKYSCIMIAAERIGLFDDLQESKTVAEIAELRGLSRESVQRLLYGLELTGLCYRDEDKWQLTGHGKRVVESPSQIRAQIRLAAVQMPQWLELGRMGTTPSEWHKQGYKQASKTWETLDFQQVMQVNADAVAKVLQNANIPVTGTVVDVGGGMGDVLVRILNVYPKLTGVVLELPEVAQLAERWISATYPKSITDRISVLSANMFACDVHWEGDANLLVNIVHDWYDGAAAELFRRCSETAPKLFVVERVVIPGREYLLAAHDLHMMAVTGGKQRTLQELTELGKQAGFSVVSAQVSESTFSVVEFAR